MQNKQELEISFLFNRIDIEEFNKGTIYPQKIREHSYTWLGQSSLGYQLNIYLSPLQLSNYAHVYVMQIYTDRCLYNVYNRFYKSNTKLHSMMCMTVLQYILQSVAKLSCKCDYIWCMCMHNVCLCIIMIIQFWIY